MWLGRGGCGRWQVAGGRCVVWVRVLVCVEYAKYAKFAKLQRTRAVTARISLRETFL